MTTNPRSSKYVDGLRLFKKVKAISSKPTTKPKPKSVTVKAKKKER